MENTQLQLLAELPGLEAAKQAIEARIGEIHRVLTEGGNQLIPPPRALDPSYLGRDVLGRIKRKRTLSPEVRAAKVESIKKARQARLDKLKAEMREEIKAEAPAAVVEPPVAPVEPGKKTRGARRG